MVRKLWDPIGCHAITWQATISAKGHRRDLQSISWWNGSSRETPTLKRPRKRLVAEKHGIQDVCLAMGTGRSFGIIKGFRCVWNTQYLRFLWVAFGTRWRSLESHWWSHPPKHLLIAENLLSTKISKMTKYGKGPPWITYQRHWRASGSTLGSYQPLSQAARSTWFAGCPPQCPAWAAKFHLLTWNRRTPFVEL